MEQTLISEELYNAIGGVLICGLCITIPILAGLRCGLWNFRANIVKVVYFCIAVNIGTPFFLFIMKAKQLKYYIEFGALSIIFSILLIGGTFLGGYIRKKYKQKVAT